MISQCEMKQHNDCPPIHEGSLTSERFFFFYHDASDRAAFYEININPLCGPSCFFSKKDLQLYAQHKLLTRGI